MGITVSDLGNLLAGQVSPLQMTQGGSNQGLNQFFNTPAFQMQYGTGPSNQLSLFGQYNPSLAFVNDPGVQMAVSQGQIPLQNQMASHGLAQSGALTQALTDYMYNHYTDYTHNQANTFQNYQNQLAGLAQLGSQNSGANNAFSASQNLSSLIGNAFNTTGQNIASANLQSGNNLANANLQAGNSIANANIGAGNNISSLLGNQGVLNASTYLNTAAAQSNNLFNGMSLLAQIEAANNASQNGQQAGMMSGMGQLQGMQGKTGGLF